MNQDSKLIKSKLGLRECIQLFSGDGHCWVCDGGEVGSFTEYEVEILSNGEREVIWLSSSSVSFLHMNWGWELADSESDEDGVALTNNGWYDCTVNYTQTSSESENFQYFQYVIYQIQP